MLISVLPSHSEILSTPTKLSLTPLPTPTATTNDSDHFSLAFAPHPKTVPVPAEISAGSSDAMRRVLAAAAYLSKQRIAAKGSRGRLFSTEVGDRGFRIANLQAGYGMVCMDPAYLHDRNGTAMEEPSYVFLKTSMKF